MPARLTGTCPQPSPHAGREPSPEIGRRSDCALVRVPAFAPSPHAGRAGMTSVASLRAGCPLPAYGEGGGGWGILLRPSSPSPTLPARGEGGIMPARLTGTCPQPSPHAGREPSPEIGRSAPKGPDGSFFLYAEGAAGVESHIKGGDGHKKPSAAGIASMDTWGRIGLDGVRRGRGSRPRSHLPR